MDQPADERRSSSLRRENRDTVKEISQNGNGNMSSSKSITNIAPSTPQKTGRISNGNMSSGSMNSVIFPLLSDVSVCSPWTFYEVFVDIRFILIGFDFISLL